MAMIDYHNLYDPKPVPTYRSKSKCYSETIYTFDIEVSSLFYIDGEWKNFDKGISDYKDIPKCAVPYIWMFGIDDNVYYGRELRDFYYVLESISNPRITKYIWIHNLGYEMQFLRTLFEEHNLTVTDLIARENRRPIAFKIEELNIVFRCSMHLTGLKLETAAKRFTSLEKKVGDLDYNIVRSPMTQMNQTELGYCEYDIRTLYYIVLHFKNKYKHLKCIPHTSTGEMRRAYSKICPGYHFENMRKLVPDVYTYRVENAAFAGGLTHGNILYVDQYLIEPMASYDESSAYPFHMCLKEYPQNPFRWVKPEHIWKYNHKQWCVLYGIRFTGAKSRYWNHYIARSKCRFEAGTDAKCAWDNGRLISSNGESFFMWITDIDYDIIREAYDFEDIKIVKCAVSKKGYLPKHYIELVLQLYSDKTTKKAASGPETEEEKKERVSFYNSQKSLLNSSFGACCTNIIKSTVEYKDNDWMPLQELTDAVIKEKLDAEREKKRPLFAYQHGVWITAASRRSLFSMIMKMDEDVVYYDTDSIKFRNVDKHISKFQEHNEWVDAELKKMCEYYDIDYSLTRPVDPKGVEHPLGRFENEGDPITHTAYTEFCTLGAKRYCYRDVTDGELHITVSGVNKSGAASLADDIRNFNKNTFFDYDAAKKNIAMYIDDMAQVTFTDVDGWQYTSTYKYGVCIYPTTYKMSMTDEFLSEIDKAKILLEVVKDEQDQLLDLQGPKKDGD